MIQINQNSALIPDHSGELKNIVKQSAVNSAWKVLKRDLKKVCRDASDDVAPVRLRINRDNLSEECFRLYVEGQGLVIEAGDEMGFVYGLYGVSREILGIEPFWFWNDQKLEKRDKIQIPDDYKYESRPFAVRLRGWFVNDEVLLHTWYVNRRKDEPWEMVFEALLRLGGNMVIPGTDSNSKKYKGLASSMGLAITHHHAEPLGAEMFARAYPGVNPSYDENGGLFRKIWEEGIRAQKDMKVIWNLGFRGQGDYPFWENDPKYSTLESRGKLMSSLIRLQYDMVRDQVPDAVCCTNLYGETMELYKEGYLDLPDDVIKIWADNGFGKMVTRRQWNHNPRIYALPEKDGGRHGIYYHVSFYDLQAANHITMLPNSLEFIKRELETVMELGVRDYWVINCSNIKPHVFYLEFIAKMWQDGTVDPDEQLENYIERYYLSKKTSEIGNCFREYWNAAPLFGVHEDEHAGDQFPNHMSRVLACQFMKNREERAEYMLWASDAENLDGQIRWYKEICEEGVQNFSEYIRQCERTALEIENPDAERLFRDSLLLQGQIYYYSYCGAEELCTALLTAEDGSYENLQKAFYHAGRAKKAFEKADACMRSREHGKWKEFYANDCFTDVKQSAWVMEALMSYLRNLGDGPHYYFWQRDFLYSEEDKRVMLLLNLENHLRDSEMFEQMEAKWGEQR